MEKHGFQLLNASPRNWKITPPVDRRTRQAMHCSAAEEAARDLFSNTREYSFASLHATKPEKKKKGGGEGHGETKKRNIVSSISVAASKASSLHLLSFMTFFHVPLCSVMLFHVMLFELRACSTRDMLTARPGYVHTMLIRVMLCCATFHLCFVSTCPSCFSPALFVCSTFVFSKFPTRVFTFCFISVLLPVLTHVCKMHHTFSATPAAALVVTSCSTTRWLASSSPAV